MKRAKDRDEQLEPEDVFSPMTPSKMIVSTMMTGHDDGYHAEYGNVGRIESAFLR